MNHKRLHRRTYLVERSFQLKYSLMLAAAGAAVSLLFGAMTYVAHAQARADLERELAVRLGGPLPSQLTSGLRDAELTVAMLTLACALLMGAALSLFGVLVTHRVAGPVHVLNQYLDVMRAGRYPAVRPVRRGDELKDVFDHFTAALRSLREREELEAQQLEDAAKVLEEGATSPQAQQALVAVRSVRSRIQEALSSPCVPVVAPPEPRA